ncbi:hypothetical protein SAMN05421759_11143 [Roseivivax lentus]|uniref:Uncharacterized protein n=1 Tax=Roseivivax lentus TaxID=633194 RepID=A0A1N7NYR0_9RHOB|nr:hypothetical protein [Roseivivax lentus]SIT03487.1 hypothetical protein SAMN05421759_11143 [Roseivivax lentus]
MTPDPVIWASREFEVARAGLPAHLAALHRLHRRRERHRSVVTEFPGWLADAQGRQDDVDGIRLVTLGNLFGSYACLMQDDVIDGDAVTPMLDALASIYMLRCTETYRGLMTDTPAFWPLFHRYWTEYYAALAAEAAGERSNEIIGQKLSPLKISAAALCLRWDAMHQLPTLEDIIENFHVVVQLLDDLEERRTVSPARLEHGTRTAHQVEEAARVAGLEKMAAAARAIAQAIVTLSAEPVP